MPEKRSEGPVTGAELKSSRAIARAVSRAVALAEQPPPVRWSRPSGYGFVDRLRSLLMRLLGPYTKHQRRLDEAILRSVEAMATAHAEALERTNQQDATRLVQIEKKHLEQLDRLEDDLRELRQRFGELLSRMDGDMRRSVRGLRVDLNNTLESLKAVRTESVNALDDFRAFRETADQRLHRTAEVISGLHRRTDRLESELRALPFMSDREVVTMRDEQGRELLGFDKGFRGDGDVHSGLQEVFRGREDFIRDRQRSYLELIGDLEPVLDVGCGNGEFLDLLGEVAIKAQGVDLDPGMVERCRAKGHQVEVAEAITYLDDQPDESFGVIFSAQFIEHLPYNQLLEFLRLSQRKLVPGGQLIAETVNPHSFRAFKTFWVDLSHEKPLFPEVVLALCGLIGFDSARVFFPNGQGNLDDDLWTQGEYAVVAHKTPHHETS